MISDTHRLLASLGETEQVTQYLAIETLLESINYRDHETAVEALVEVEDLLSTDIINQLTDIYLTVIERILSEYGVVLENETDMTLTESFNLLNTIELLGYPFNREIIATVEAGDDTVYTLSEMMVASELLDRHTVLNYVKSVDGALIVKLLAPIEEDTSDNEMAIQRYRQFVDKDKIGFVHNYIKQRQRLPLDFRTLYPLLHESVSKAFGLNAVAYEIASLAMISDLPDEALVTTVMEVVQPHYDSTVFVKLSLLIDDLLKGKTHVN